MPCVYLPVGDALVCWVWQQRVRRGRRRSRRGFERRPRHELLLRECRVFRADHVLWPRDYARRWNEIL